MNRFLKILGTRMVFFDGAMGTMLLSKGLSKGDSPDSWNIANPQAVYDTHIEYLKAGCDIITSNTFGTNRFVFGDRAQVIASKGVALAKEASDNMGHGLVALSMGPTGSLLEPMGDITFEQAVQAYGEVAAAGEISGADLVLIETMTDSYELKAAVLGAKENTNLPIVATMAFDIKGKLLTGGDIPGMVAMLESLGVTALGINCGLGPKQMHGLIKMILEYTSVPVLANPNAGLPEIKNGNTIYNLNPDEFASQMEELGKLGPWMMGGCCGTTADHMARTIHKCKALPILSITPKTNTIVSSYGQSVNINQMPVIIGERINPTGKKKMQEALKTNNLEYIFNEATLQEKNGADILDVNVGMTGIDEEEALPMIIKKLQSVTSLPLQIDTANLAAMEIALRIYNGKPLLNSINGKEKELEAILPVIKHYGAAAIMLPMDENGIPETAEERIAIAKKIIKKAAKHGIPKKDLILDGLVMSVSAQPGAAQITLKTIQKAKKELGIKTILGISNISFGLPGRSGLNRSFLAMAIANGLNCAIINPNDINISSALSESAALLGLDNQFSKYIALFEAKEKNQSDIAREAQPEITLRQAVYKGLIKATHSEIVKLIKQKMPPLSIIETYLIPALDNVGRDFESGKLFLPQLLMSSQAAKEAFELLKGEMYELGQERESSGEIILATVEGDIHDIGKNIVKILLENYGFTVIDLGKNVKAQIIIETAIQKNIKLVGLSALMTTTVPFMASTIKALREAKPDCKIMVGGAVLTESYAKEIGADFYGKDAIASAQYAKALFKK